MRYRKKVPRCWIKSICDDANLMRENLLTKVSTSPDYDYEGVPLEESILDIYKRCEKHKAVYETIDDDETS